LNAYVVFFLDEILEPARLAEYRRLAVPTIAPAGGEFIVHSDKFDVLEGAAPKGVFMLRFPTMAAARSWYQSPAYRQALQHRVAAARCRTVLVEGS